MNRGSEGRVKGEYRKERSGEDRIYREKGWRVGNEGEEKKRW